MQSREPDRPDKESVIHKQRQEMINWHTKKKETFEKIVLEHKIRKYGVMAVKDAV